MNASELFKAGRLAEAIDAQLKAVKDSAADKGRRLFLFELLAFAGDLDRARKHIDIVQYGDLSLDAAVLNYSRLLDAEQTRRKLFSEGLAPRFLGEVPDHVHLRLEALKCLRESKPAEAKALLDKARQLSWPVTGKLNGKAFQTLWDCDDLFGSVLEVLAKGNYFWVPIEQVSLLALTPPKFARDLLWASGRLELREGAAGDVFLPVLYPGSHEHADPQIKLGRLTDWKVVESGPVLGVGLRTFLIDDDPSTLLEWRELEIDDPTPAAEAAAAVESAPPPANEGAGT